MPFTSHDQEPTIWSAEFWPTRGQYTVVTIVLDETTEDSRQQLMESIYETMLPSQVGFRRESGSDTIELQLRGDIETIATTLHRACPHGNSR